LKGSASKGIQLASDPYRYFRIEARELVDGLSQGVLELDKNPNDSGAVARMLRLAHTLKGAARVVKQLHIANHSHQIEEVLVPLRELGQPLVPHQAKVLLEHVDHISALLLLLSPKPEPAAQVAEKPQLASAPDDAFQSLRIDVEEMDGLLRALTETGVQVASLKRELNELRRVSGLSTALASRLQLRSRGESRAVEATELGLALDVQTGLERIVQSLNDRAERVEQELVDVRQGADRLRLVPVQALWGPLSRTVRDAAQTLVKEVNFELEGGALRLDAQVLGPLRDALLHLVRNAVAHGVEPPAERIAAGKERRGTVRLVVSRAGGAAVFTCSDDGCGVDASAVRSELIRRGEIDRAAAEALSQQALLERLLAGGLSTAREVTQISGRGIGLDVLRETVLRLKGQVNVETDPGRGTKIAVRVPISLASLRAILVESSGATVAIPLDAVRQAVRLAPEDFRRAAQGDSVACGGDVIPFLPLTRVLRRDRGAPSRGATSAIVVTAAHRSAAFGVDALLGTFEIVVKPLPLHVNTDAVVAGVSLDAEGTPRLVLDPSELVAAAFKDGPRVEPVRAEHRPILVIDDSLTTRMLEQSILESAGYEVELAASAEEGLEKARNRAFGIFLVDVEMPGMSGFEFVAQTRADIDLRAVPAILVTSLNKPEDLERGRRVGASDYIVKGEFDQKRLLASIGRLLGS